MSDVRAECKRRVGDIPCFTIRNADGDVTSTHECTDWCPVLNRTIEEANDEADEAGDAP
jgi:hypothetical protein